MNSADRDRFFLAFVAYAEARNQGQEGIRAQIHSVLNRHKEGDWDAGKTISATLFKPYAYSAMNSKDPNRVAAACVDMDDFMWQLCMAEAEAALLGTSNDPTDGATHYYLGGTEEPDWVTGIVKGVQVAPPAVFCKQIGKHLFYKSVK